MGRGIARIILCGGFVRKDLGTVCMPCEAESSTIRFFGFAHLVSVPGTPGALDVESRCGLRRLWLREARSSGSGTLSESSTTWNAGEKVIGVGIVSEVAQWPT